MLVGTLCSRRPIAVAAGAPISDVARMMRDQHVGALIVTECDGERPRVAGTITDRDIVRAQLERTDDLLADVAHKLIGLAEIVGWQRKVERV